MMSFLISDPFMYGTNEDEFGKTRFIVALICIFFQWISFCLTSFSDIFLLSYCRTYINLYCFGCCKQKNSASELHILSWSYWIEFSFYIFIINCVFLCYEHRMRVLLPLKVASTKHENPHGLFFYIGVST